MKTIRSLIPLFRLHKWGFPAIVLLGLLMSLTEGVGIGLFILPRAFNLGRASLRILVESAPAHIDVDAVERDLEQLDGVLDAHDLHVWTITSGMDAVSVHLKVEVGYDTHAVLDRSRDVLRDRHHISHATIQVEPAGHEGCNLVQW